MPLYLLYTMVQKVKNDQKLKSRGGSCLNPLAGGYIRSSKIAAFPHCLKNFVELFGKKYMQHLDKNKLVWFVFSSSFRKKYGVCSNISLQFSAKIE